MHGRLREQLRRAGLDPARPVDADALRRFLQAVDTAYKEDEERRELLEQSLELSARDLADLQEGLRRLGSPSIAAADDLFFDLSLDPLVVIGFDGFLRRVNPAFAAVVGEDPADLVDRAFLDLVHPEDRAEALEELRRPYASGDTARFSVRFPVAEGEPRWLQWAAVPVPGEELVHALARDVTEERATRDELRRAKESAEEAVRVKGEFLANMSHEIRTPLNAVIGMSALLGDGTLSEEQRDYLDTIRVSGEALLRIVNDILDFSRIEAGRLELEDEPFTVADCVEEALDQVTPDAVLKGLDLAYEIEPGTPRTVRGDVTRLRQVLVNLLGNAVKFTAKGEVTVRVASRPAGERAHELTVAVRDTGIGIPEDARDRLFRSFSQVDSSTTRRFGGTGLGLAISRNLCRLMDGDIGVESEPGRGATFTFTVRVGAVDEDRHRFDAGDRPQVAGRRLLVVDDNPTNRRLLTLQAERWGLRYVAAADAEEALRRARSGEPYDAVLLDMVMPGMDGLDLAAALRRERPELPLVMLTSVGRPEEDPRWRGGADFAAVLTKPIKPSALFDVLAELFSGDGSGDPDRVEVDFARRHPLRILLAEDNAVNRKVALHVLSRLGYEAATAADGREALERLEAEPFDVVLMDVQMPAIDGLEATRLLKERLGDAAPRVVAMTANVLRRDREACFAAGMDDYVSKPVRVRDLRDALARASTAREERKTMTPENPAPRADLFDADRLLDLTGGDDDFAREILCEFLDETPRTLENLERAVAAGDAARVRLESHSLKGSSLSIGADALAAAAAEVEDLAREGRVDAAAATRLVAAYAEVEPLLRDRTDRRAA